MKIYKSSKVLILSSIVNFVFINDCLLSKRLHVDSSSVYANLPTKSTIKLPNRTKIDAKNTRNSTIFMLSRYIDDGCKVEYKNLPLGECEIICYNSISLPNQSNGFECNQFAYDYDKKTCILPVKNCPRNVSDTMTMTSNNYLKQSSTLPNNSSIKIQNNYIQYFKRTLSSNFSGPIENFRSNEHFSETFKFANTKCTKANYKSFFNISYNLEISKQECGEKCLKETQNDNTCLGFEVCQVYGNRFKPEPIIGCHILTAKKLLDCREEEEEEEDCTYKTLAQGNNNIRQVFLNDLTSFDNNQICSLYATNYLLADFDEVDTNILGSQKTDKQNGNDWPSHNLSYQSIYAQNIDDCSYECSISRSCLFFKYQVYYSSYDSSLNSDCILILIPNNNVAASNNHNERGSEIDDIRVCSTMNRKSQNCKLYRKRFIKIYNRKSSNFLLISMAAILIFALFAAFISCVLMLKMIFYDDSQCQDDLAGNHHHHQQQQKFKDHKRLRFIETISKTESESINLRPISRAPGRTINYDLKSQIV